MKSPFIEFRATEEILSNVSVSLNASTTERGLNRNGPFVYPNDLRNGSLLHEHEQTYNRHDALSRSRHREHNLLTHQMSSLETTENPVIADMNSKKEVTIIEVHTDEDYPDDKTETERKYIIPLALKNPTAEPRKSQIFQDSSTNIDDLKRHILMLQNLTKNDQSFQSKFVVFPNLQRNTTQTIEATSPKPPPTKNSVFLPRINTVRQTFRNTPVQQPQPDHDDDFHKLEKITIVPQVFLQNDQMPMNDDSFEQRSSDKKEARLARRKNYRNKLMSDDGFARRTTIKTTTTTTTTTNRPMRKSQRRRKPGSRRNNRNPSRKPAPCRNDNNDCMLSRELNILKSANVTAVTTISQPTLGIENKTIENKELNQLLNVTSRHDIKTINYPHANVNNDDLSNDNKTFNVKINNKKDRPIEDDDDDDDEIIGGKINRKLSRMARSHHRNITKDLLFPSAVNTNQTLNNYKENIDLNPDLCYRVGGLSYGQQKLCVLHTHVMPAISRGARSAIQVNIKEIILYAIILCSKQEIL